MTVYSEDQTYLKVLQRRLEGQKKALAALEAVYDILPSVRDQVIRVAGGEFPDIDESVQAIQALRSKVDEVSIGLIEARSLPAAELEDA